MDEILKNMDIEKRDRVINSAIEEFSVYPYEKASTNNIVKNAEISKGLLFHYFGNKKELYEALIEFVLNNLVNGITGGIDWDETDLFERIKQMVMVKMDIGRKYPNMFDFLLKVLTDMNTKKIEDVMKFYDKYGVNIQSIMGDVYSRNIDFSLFSDTITLDKSIKVIQWTLEKYVEEKLLSIDKMENYDFDQILTELDEYINILKKALYN